MESIPYVFLSIAKFGSSLPDCDEFDIHPAFHKAVARAKLVLRPYPEFVDLSYNQIVALLLLQAPIPMCQGVSRFQHFSMQTYLNILFTTYRVNDAVACLICHTNDPALITTAMPCCQATVHKTCRMAAVLPHNGHCYFCQASPDFVNLLSDLNLHD